MAPFEDRWPPVYDADDLKAAIKKLVGNDSLQAHFYASVLSDPKVCQGDVVALAAPPIPVIDEGGQPGLFGDGFRFWLVIGNTCDFDRDIDDVPWTQIVPLIDLGTEPEKLSEHRSYKAARSFYLPPWPNSDGHHYSALLLQPVALHKRAFGKGATVVARLDRSAWLLLHSCLVRFLARDDGRFDAGEEAAGT